MSAMAAPPPAAASRHLDSVLSFSGATATSPDAPDSPHAAAAAAPAAFEFSDAGSDSDTDADEFEFAFAPPLSPRAGGGGPALVPADDLFAHGRIVPAYPLFDRHLRLLADDDAHHDGASLAAAAAATSSSSTAPPSPDTYCAWAPRSAPGSPSRDRDRDRGTPPFPKSASTGEARRFWRLRDLVAGGGGRSRSDGKEKFVFLQSGSSSSSPAGAAPSDHKAVAAAPLQKQKQKQGKKKKPEMDMATAHRLFYGKPGATAAAAGLAGDRTKQQQSYLPYRPGIVGFFASAHALGRSHHPY